MKVSELFKPLAIRCPNCGVDLLRMMTPIGYVLLVVLVVAIIAYGYLILRYPVALAKTWLAPIYDPFPLIGLIVFGLPISLFVERWGYKYIIADGSGDEPNLK